MAQFHIIHCLHIAKKEDKIQYGYRKWGLMQECFPKHLRVGQQE